ncbi:MAG TPA: sigma-70 family RNA polymerase sigma factor [Oligoflexia bacterium]|nr:sigma-70 family RNA polymerase sigma factor [Oligoflexia bacterium]HMP48171.1 sigma-70 family RNA polymerase sigma factor [Oligoflexia bacterium]
MIKVSPLFVLFDEGLNRTEYLLKKRKEDFLNTSEGSGMTSASVVGWKNPVLSDQLSEKKANVEDPDNQVPTDSSVSERRLVEESNWIKLAVDGDREAFKNLFERYYPRLKSVAKGILLNEEDAADVCQEAFFKAYRNLSSFRGGSSFYTWMYRIVYNLCIDLGRRSYRKREVTAVEGLDFEQVGGNSTQYEYLPPPPSSPEDELYRARLGEIIRVAMEELSPSHRAVIRLREIDGLSYDEISKATGCSTGTVMSRLHHARKKLIDILKEMLDEK